MVTCPRCTKEMVRRGYNTQSEGKVQKWFCKDCRLYRQAALSKAEITLLKKTVARILDHEFKVTGES